MTYRRLHTKSGSGRAQSWHLGSYCLSCPVSQARLVREPDE